MSIATIPNVYYEFAFNADPNQNAVPPYWQDLSPRVQFAWDAAQGGRQYELDVNEAGTWRPVLANPDGALDPSNTASPFAPGQKLYRGCRIRVPLAPTQNLLPQIIATGLTTMNAVSDSAGNWFAPFADSVAQALYLSAAPNGATTAVGYTFPAGRTTATVGLYAGVNPSALLGPVADCVQVGAGKSYTASAYLSRAASADATVQFAMNIAWFNSVGASTGITSGSAVTVPTSGWVRAVTSATAPAGSVWGRPYLVLTAPATTTAQNTLYATGWQMEQAAAVTAWADPGLTRFLFTGGAERWTQTWTELNGTYGTSAPVGVDAFAGLSLPTLLAPFVNEVLALGPSFFYQLAEPAGSTACVDSAARRLPAPVENSPYGVGSLTFGNGITATTPSTGAFVGTPGPVATFNNPNNNNQNPATFISLHKAGRGGPPTAGNWTRIIHVRVPVGGFGNAAWQAMAGISSNASFVAFTATPAVKMFVQAANNTTISVYTGASIADGNWHQLGITVSGTGAVLFYVDGVQFAANGGTSATVTLPFQSPMTDTIGSLVDTISSSYENGWVGDIALAAEFPTVLSAAQMTNLYNSWRTASAGESSDARYRRVLTWVSYSGPTAIDSGATRSMGPATDLTGATVLDALNSIATTENGDNYTSPAGVLTFKSRTARYNSRTPAFTFGENTGAGEWPCEVTAIDFDPSHLANNIQVTQYGGPIATAINAASAQSYFSRTYQRTINVSSINEAIDASNYLLGRYKDPHLRTEVVRLHPSAVPGLFAVCAQLEKGMRIRVNRRPISAPQITVDCFIEQVHWTWDPDKGDVWCEIQASPADLANYWVLAALHTTLSAQATSGTNTATINALPDAAVNKLAQSLPSGYSLTFEPGTSRAETMTIAPGGIPSTSLGYSTATLTFTSNFAFTHASGTTVCEPLPTGYTDPTAWDASSVLGAASTTVLSGGASGTNTVTVNALADSKVNALGSNWNIGDVIWLSPGTANFETATILSVATTYPGYSSCQITLTANLAHNHAVGDTVCDPLPAGVTSPAALSPTTRAAY